MKLCAYLLLLLTAVASVAAGRWTDRLNTASEHIYNKTSSWIGGSSDEIETDLWFCHGKPCPAFTTTKKGDGYIIRRYQAATWVTDHLNSSAFQYALAKGSLPLHQYLKGKNDKKATMALGSPLTVTINNAGSYSHLPEAFTLALYLGNESTTEAPKPTNPDLGIYSSPVGEVYVYQFGGIATGNSVLSSAQKLAAILDKAGIKYNTDTFLFALYDGPTHLTHRHNEIWFMPADKPSVEVATSVKVDATVA